MNILVIGRKYVESFAMHISETLTEMNHNVILFEPGVKRIQSAGKIYHQFLKLKTHVHDLYRQTPIGLRYEERRLNNFIDDFQIDLIISCHDFIAPKHLENIKKKYGCKTALWFPDAVSNFGKAMFLDAPYDFLFFKEPFIVDVIKRELNKNAYYLPECCNPKYHNKIDISYADIQRYGCDICTAGNMHTARSALFKLLKGYNVKIWGNPAPIWMNTTDLDGMIQNHFVSNFEKSKAFRCSKIVVNTMHPTEIKAANVRLFEAAATGSFQICNHRDSIKDLYQPGLEIETFNTISELKQKLDYYLNHPEQRLAFAEAAYIRTMNQHTYKKRLELMLNTIFNNAQGFTFN